MDNSEKQMDEINKVNISFQVMRTIGSYQKKRGKVVVKRNQFCHKVQNLSFSGELKIVYIHLDFEYI